VLGLATIVLLATAVIAALMAGVFMWLGARIASVRNATFGRSVVAAIVVSLVMWLVTLASSVMPVMGGIAGLALGLILGIFVIQGIFGTTFGRALLVWVFNVVAQVSVVVLTLLVSGQGVPELGGG